MTYFCFVCGCVSAYWVHPNGCFALCEKCLKRVIEDLFECGELDSIIRRGRRLKIEH